MSELDSLMEAFGKAGGDSSILASENIAHLAASGHRLLSVRDVAGLQVSAKGTLTGISAAITVREGIKVENPVHLCFGVLHKRGHQKIKMDIRLQKNAAATFVAHCIFPKAEKVTHIMDAQVEIGEGAEMRYSETHYHGLYGGTDVRPRSVVKVGRNGRYFSDFTLVTGIVGSLDIDYAVDAGENAVSELTARIFGHASDEIRIKEKVSLNGENARGLIKTRIAIEDRATAEVTGITEGNAAYARGHVDCLEIVKDNAVARAVPIVNVSNPLAKVTHEAAIGSVDKKQIETLMAHGLTPREAVDLIVKGMLQ